VKVPWHGHKVPSPPFQVTWFAKGKAELVIGKRNRFREIEGIAKHGKGSAKRREGNCQTPFIGAGSMATAAAPAPPV